MAGLSRIRLFLVGLAALAAIGCQAQTPSPIAATAKADSTNVDAKTARKIEVLARSKLNVPAEYQIAVGPRSPSQMEGFDTVKLTFSLPNHPEHTQTLLFLLSKDGQTLARLSEWSLAKNPADLVPYAGRPVRGNPAAKVVIVNFDDLECPYCAKLHAELFPETLDHYKGLVKIVYRDLPLEELHPWAMHAAVDANCLAAQSAPAYWSYVDYLHIHGQDVTGPDRDLTRAKATLDKLAMQQAEKSKLDSAKVTACVSKQDETAIRAEMKEADALGLSSTPVVFVNGEEMDGALETSTLWAIIDRALVAEGITPPPMAAPSAPAAKPTDAGSGGTPAKPVQAPAKPSNR